MPGDSFELTKTGSIKKKAGVSINFEEISRHELTVTAMDSGGMIGQKLFYVNVVDKNDPPVIEDQIRSAPESLKHRDYIGNKLEAFDEDQSPSQTILFRVISQEHTKGFGISEKSGQLFLDKLVLDYEKYESHSLKV